MTMPARRVAALLLPTVLLVAACGSGGGAATTVPASAAASEPAMTGPAMTEAAITAEPAMTAEPDMTAEPAMTAEPGMTPEPSAAGGTPNAAVASLQMHPWATMPLTDVATGQTFTIADLAGKPVFVESMAIWCTNCRAQQGRFTEAFGKLAPGTAEYVVLTVDPSETSGDLARYRSERGFTGRYAVAGKDVAKALEAEFGANVLNPPSVPVMFISPAGEVSFSTGPETVDQILEKAGA